MQEISNQNLGQERVRVGPTWYEIRPAVGTYDHAVLYIKESCKQYREIPVEEIPIQLWEKVYGYPHEMAYASPVPPVGVSTIRWKYLSLDERKRLLALPMEERPEIIKMPSQLWPDAAAAPAPVPVPAPVPAPLPHPVVEYVHPVPAPERLPVPLPRPAPAPVPPAPLSLMPPASPLPGPQPVPSSMSALYKDVLTYIKRGCGCYGGPEFDLLWVNGWSTKEIHAAGGPPVYVPTYAWEKVYGYPHEMAYKSASAPEGVHSIQWERLSHQQRRDLLAFPKEIRGDVLATWTHAPAPPAGVSEFDWKKLSQDQRAHLVAAPRDVRAQMLTAFRRGEPIPAPVPAPPSKAPPAPPGITIEPPPAIVHAAKEPPRTAADPYGPLPLAPVPPQIQSVVRPSVEPTPVSAQFVRSIQPVLTPQPLPYLPAVISAPAAAPPPPPLVMPEEIHLPPEEEEGPNWVLYVLLAGAAYYALVELD